MMASWSKRMRGERGASLVEFALVLSLLMILLAGIVDLGRAFNSYMVITNASREGARYASRFPADRNGIIAAVQQEAQGNRMNPADIGVTIEPDPGSGPPATGGQRIRVTVTYNYRMFLAGFLRIDASLDMRARTEMVVFGPE